MEFLSGAYFEVSLFEEDDTAVYDDREEKLAGRFTSVSGLNMRSTAKGAAITPGSS